jgi:uncharacterized protein (TIGR04168 family)
MSEIARIAVVGDLHGHWDDWDTRYFSAAAYDLLLFTGDLGSGSGDHGVRIARSVGRLEKPTLVIPGNNDESAAPQIAAELRHQRGLLALLKLGGRALGAASGQVHLAGYSLHAYTLAGRSLTVLAARPYAMGGSELSFADALRASFEIDSMAASSKRLCALVERVETDELIVLAHNGPTGLGGSATDLWGRDFVKEAGDWGDADLADALLHAHRCGKRVLAVVAGHMHSPTRGGETRVWQAHEGGTLYLNAARVPRILERADGQYRHHIALELEAGNATARELWVRVPND